MAERPARRRKPSKSVEQLKAEISARDEAKAQRAAERKAAKKPLTPAERHEQEKAARKVSTFSQHRMTGSRGHGSEYSVPSRLREDFVISYLLDEGFASDEKSAQAIASAMSEEWVQSIVETFASQDRLKELGIDKKKPLPPKPPRKPGAPIGPVNGPGGLTT